MLTSSWSSYFNKVNNHIIPIHKKGYLLMDLFHRYSIEIYDIIIDDRDSIKQNRIKKWLKEHNDIENFIIIDDKLYGLDEFKSNLIQTSYLNDGEIVMDMKDAFGLCEEHIKEANEILNGKNSIFHK